MIRRTSRRGVLFLLFATTILGTVIMPSASYSSGPSERPLFFSNKDLEPYKDTAGPATREAQPLESKSPEVKEAKFEDPREQREKEYWCGKATPLRKKVQRLSEETREKERELAEENAKGSVRNKKAQALNKELAKARKNLKNAQEDFSDIADEAHRKGVPQGWLRCQFE